MKLFIKLMISAVLLGVLVWMMGGVRPLLAQMAELDPWYALATVAVITADRVLMTYKWGLLLNSLDQRLPLWRGVRIYCAAMIWGMVMPSTIGADAVRIYATRRQGLDAHRVTATVVMERLIGFLAALVMGMVAVGVLVMLGHAEGWMLPVLAIAGATLLAGMVALACSFHDAAFNLLHEKLLGRWRDNRIATTMRKFHDGYRTFGRHRGTLIVFFLLSLLEQMTPVLHCWLIARGMGIEVGLLFFTGAVPLSILLARLPVSMDGLGVFDAAFAALLAWAGATPTEAVAIAFAGRIVQTAALLPWWLWQLLIDGGRPPRRQESPPITPALESISRSP
ncbi:MAG: flippase-like domain-containing protein [Phycisphaeraceae bacterium]|nr:flippase-like domain-containing protein [Phycisphaeraceae bacterium]